MEFSMKGGGFSRDINVISNMFFLKKHLELFPDCQNMFCT